MANPYSVNLNENIQRLKLNVRQIAAGHGPRLTTMADLRAAMMHDHPRHPNGPFRASSQEMNRAIVVAVEPVDLRRSFDGQPLRHRAAEQPHDPPNQAPGRKQPSVWLNRLDPAAGRLVCCRAI